MTRIEEKEAECSVPYLSYEFPTVCIGFGVDPPPGTTVGLGPPFGTTVGVTVALIQGADVAAIIDTSGGGVVAAIGIGGDGVDVFVAVLGHCCRCWFPGPDVLFSWVAWLLSTAKLPRTTRRTATDSQVPQGEAFLLCAVWWT
jgi:hypothetical protein